MRCKAVPNRVRFLPSGYVVPLRAAPDLTDWQRRVVQVIARGKEPSFSNIRTQIIHLSPTVLKQIAPQRPGLIDSRGHGRGAVRFLGATPKFEDESNTAE
jgi:hypothetical protein